MLSTRSKFVVTAATLLLICTTVRAADPPTINPFGRKPAVREDAVPGYVEMSDGRIYVGQIYLTRDKRLEIHDRQLQRQREVPLRAVKQIECRIVREWIEKEWRFEEPGNPKKVYSGRTYPAREYLHRITLHDGRTITGPLSALVYVQPSVSSTEGKSTGSDRPPAKAERLLLNKRSKGRFGEDLESLVYVKLIKLGEEALAEGRKKAATHHSQPN
ncbi:MAG: hypothetical protein V3R99_04775 [Thermoguttaceae bacterium]